MKNPIHKGIFFYEIQIWFFVFMWQHDCSYERTSQKNDLFRCGKFFVWWDSVGFHNKYKFIKKTKLFIESFKNFIILSKQGDFSIKKYKSYNVETFMFFWNETKTDNFRKADIHLIRGNFYIEQEGRVLKIK